MESSNPHTGSTKVTQEQGKSTDSPPLMLIGCLTIGHWVVTLLCLYVSAPVWFGLFGGETFRDTSNDTLLICVYYLGLAFSFPASLFCLIVCESPIAFNLVVISPGNSLLWGLCFYLWLRHRLADE